jgi:hypothetical protein
MAELARLIEVDLEKHWKPNPVCVFYDWDEECTINGEAECPGHGGCPLRKGPVVVVAKGTAKGLASVPLQ